MISNEYRQQKVDFAIEHRVKHAKDEGWYIEEYRGFALILDYGKSDWPVGIDAEPVTVEAHALCFEDGSNGWIPNVPVDLRRHGDEVVQDLRARIDGWYTNGVQPDQGRIVMVFATMREAVEAAGALHMTPGKITGEC